MAVKGMIAQSESKRCPKCGRPIPAEAPQGLCPKCLLLQATLSAGGGTGQTEQPVPTREELAAVFPQLEILELIGQGGMGFVFKARQPKLERLVALKILSKSLASEPAFAERFTREGRVLARLNHPNIVTIHDFGQEDGFFYLLLEFVDGVNLRQAMKVGRFTPSQALAIVPKICEALEFAHNEGILHRDIKPENILLDTKGRVKIADFGIAKLVAGGDSAAGHAGTAAPGPGIPANLTETGKALGTPDYMAPEQREHPAEVDQRADIYSLGVVFYEMLTGELPLGRFPPPSEKSSADPRVDSVVLRTLETERERRYQQIGEVKTDLENMTAVARTPLAGQLKAAAHPGANGLSSLALISFVCSFGLAAGSLPGIVCGHLARKRLRRDPSLRGRRLALAGLGISYFFLFASSAFLTVGFFALTPRTGHQLTTAEQAANPAAVRASRRVDEIAIGDPASESDHAMRTQDSGSGQFSGRPMRIAIYGGCFSYEMKVDPARPMSLYCTYWGNDASGRRFDVLINDTVIATQTLEFNDPGHFFDVEYQIPEKLTRGQTAVTVTFQAYPRKTAGGLYGCQMLTR